MKYKKLTSLILLAFAFTIIYSQQRIIHRHFTTKDGLSHNSIGTIIKDRKGFIWLGTWNGLNRYDGYNFAVFKPDLEKFKFTGSYRIISLIEDLNNNIWTITYDEKILLFNTKTNKFENVFGEKIYDEKFKVKDIYKNNNDLIISTYNYGIFIVDISQNYHVSHILINKNDSINDLSIDKLNYLWFKSGNNVYIIKKISSKNYIYMPVNQIINNLPGKINRIFSTNGLLFLIFDNNKIFIYDPIHKSLKELYLYAKNITLIKHYHEDDYIFCQKNNGIKIFDINNKKIKHNIENNFLANVYSIYIDSKYRIWIETQYPGIFLIDPSENFNIKHFEQKIFGDYDIQKRQQCGYFEDNKGNVWVNLKGGGFGFYDNITKKFQYFYNNPFDNKSILSNKVNSFFYDSLGILWLSTSKKGLDKIIFIDDFFNYIDLSNNNILENEIRSFYKLRNENNLLIGTKGKKLYLCDSTFKIKEFNYKFNSMIYSIFQDKYNNIYLGTKGNGLFILKTNKKSMSVKNYTFNNEDIFSLSCNNIYSITEDKSGKVWIATYGGGINIYIPDSGNKFYNYNNLITNYPFSNNRVRDIKVDSKNNVWIATTEGLILCLNNNNIRNLKFFKIKEIINDVYYIFIDKNDEIWIATLGGGLFKLKNYLYDSINFQIDNFTKKDGLPSDVVLTIEKDKNSRLWFSTENNIFFYDKNKKFFYVFNENDGIDNVNFSEGAVYNFNGNLIYGTNTGILWFNPDSLKIKDEKINIVFTSFKLFNQEIFSDKNPEILQKSIDEQNEIKLRYNQNFFTIYFVTLNYKIQNKIKYSYFLENYDKEWNIVENNYASYTNVAPGKYKFIVKAIYPPGIAGNSKTLTIQILPPLWKTTTAYLIYFVLTILLTYLIYKIIKSYIDLRNKVIINKELLELKNNFFTTISHELKTPLTLISGPLNEIKEHENLSEKGKRYFQIIEQNTNRLVRLVTQLLELRKIQVKDFKLKLNYVNVYEFVKSIFLYFEEHACERNIEYKIICENRDIELWIDEEKMETVIFNLLSNAFKFSPNNSKIEVIITDNLNEVEIKIKDNGIGIPPEKEDRLFKPFSTAHENYYNKGITGIGLFLSKEIVTKHGGNIYFLRNKSENGVTFIVTLKKGKDHFNQENIIIINNALLNDKILIKDDKSKPKILIFEDNLQMIEYLKMTLGDEYNVAFAINAIEGIEKTKNVNPDIIISDIIMPEINGIELIKNLKNNFETSHIPIIIVSALSSIEYKIKSLDAGADAYLSKPFNIKQLKAQIANLLSQRKLLIEKFTSGVKLQLFDNSKEFFIKNKDVSFLQNLVKIIEENIDNTELKIDDIVIKMGFSRTVFYNKVKGLTGFAPVDFIRELRLQKAKILLESGEYNVSEVAYKTGFNDPGYFSKVFSERFKKPPSSFLKNKNI